MTRARRLLAVLAVAAALGAALAGCNNPTVAQVPSCPSGQHLTLLSNGKQECR